MFRYILAGILMPVLCHAQSQNNHANDTLMVDQLEEIVIISPQTISDRASKPLSSLDEYLSNANAVDMIKRGSYAWEPFLNGMASERNVVTIDGMRIYGACTDKMDPVTSYVEITNLSKVNVQSGSSGSSGATIGGSIDMQRKKGAFGDKNLSGMLFGGWESNNQQKIAGGAVSYTDTRFFANVDFTFRDAENYKAGGGEEIMYAQFTKYNVSAMAGYKLNQNQHVEASVIYDHALDVGYPALPMDVSLAKAFIGSLEYVSLHLSDNLHRWETKLYHNDVTHVMDDTQRSDVPIRMDMPGWSTTTGFYSSLMGNIGKHEWEIKLSAHRNSSLAEMTMFSNNPDEKDMFMLTWPGVLTNYGDLFVENQFRLGNNWTTKLSAGLAIHNNEIDNVFGFESLRIFYPELEKSNTRLLKRAAASFEQAKNNWILNLGMAYGERAPSVSEGYGFYLFNSFDRFDYVGNPNMKNEKSISFQSAIAYKWNNLSSKLSATQFYIKDYIIGQPNDELSVMTIGAEGVKVYEQLNHANIFNIALDFDYQFSDSFLWTNNLSYRHGTGKNVKYLPMIQPFSYRSNLTYYAKSFSAQAGISGAHQQQRYNPNYGEQALPGYWIANLSAANRFNFAHQSLVVKSGVENIFDKYYTTFADWNRLPRMGRNFYLSVIYDF